MNCRNCSSPMTGVQYRFTEEDYDGISEWRCDSCKLRIGRWTGEELKDGRIEPRYGEEKEKILITKEQQQGGDGE